MMKKAFLLIMLLLVTAISQAQEPNLSNGNFASWTTKTRPAEVGGGSYQDPTGGWGTSNLLIDQSVVKTEGRTPGSSAALLTTMPLDMGDETVNTAILGTIDFSTVFTQGEPDYGIPFTGRPTHLTFWYKYEPTQGDIGRAFVEFFTGDDEHDSNNKVKYAVWFDAPTDGWVKGTVNITSSDIEGRKFNFTPSRVVVEFTPSLSGLSKSTGFGDYQNREAGPAQAGSKLWVTEVAFDYEGEAPMDHTYTVVGSSELFGSGNTGYGWNIDDDTYNMMPVPNDDGIYYLEVRAYLEAGHTYEYKVVEDHSWKVNWGLNGLNDTNNLTFTVDRTGYYIITFVFSPTLGMAECYTTLDDSNEPVQGDMDGDGKLTINDVTILVQKVLEAQP